MAIGLNAVDRLSAGSGPASHRPAPAPVILGALPLTLLIACAPDNPGTGAFADGCTLNTAAVCGDCLELEHQFQIGSVAGPGFISGRGGEDQIVRDGAGNYWISQREHMNVYGPGGEFIRTVGREGEGPMEFQYARPFHADAAGHIHIWDHLNLRVSVVTPDFELVDEKPISGQQINDMIAIDDGAFYAMQMWIGDPANPGQPIHIVDGRDVVSSFGEEYGPGDDPSDFNALETRYLVGACRRRRHGRAPGRVRDRGMDARRLAPGQPLRTRSRQCSVPTWCCHAGEPVAELPVGHARRRFRQGVDIAVAIVGRTG